MTSDSFDWSTVEARFIRLYDDRDLLHDGISTAAIERASDSQEIDSQETKFHVRISDPDDFCFEIQRSPQFLKTLLNDHCQLAHNSEGPVIMVDSDHGYGIEIISKSWSKEVKCDDYNVVKHGVLLIERFYKFYGYSYFDLDEAREHLVVCFVRPGEENGQLRDIITDPNSSLIFVWMSWGSSSDKLMCVNPKDDRIIWSKDLPHDSPWTPILISTIRRKALVC